MCSLTIILGLSATCIYLIITTSANQGDCVTLCCIKSSHMINEYLNSSVEPCDDFYSYACGRWPQVYPRQPGRRQYSWFSVLREKIERRNEHLLTLPGSTYRGQHSTAIEKAKTYYASCMSEFNVNKLGIKPLEQLIKTLGSWSITGPWNPYEWNMTTALTIAHRLDSDPFFSVYVAANPNNTDSHQITIAESGLTMNKRDYYIDSKMSNLTRAAMVSFARKFAELMHMPIAQTQQKFNRIWTFEQKLAKIFATKEEKMDPWNYRQNLTISELQKKFGNLIDLKLYLGDIFKRSFTDSDRIVVVHGDYYEKMVKLIENTEKELLADYIVWMTVYHQLSYLPNGFEEAYDILWRPITSEPARKPRWKKCLKIATGMFGYPVSAAYIEQYVTDKMISKAKEMTMFVLEALENRLKTVPWMDEPTRAAALEKYGGLVSQIGFPKWMNDPAKLDEKFDKMAVTGFFFHDHLELKKARRQQRLDRLSKPTDRTDWSMNPDGVNAYYSISYNQIIVPAGLLQSPFLDPDFPMSVNFGALGMFLGHELSHGFDSHGSTRDKTGNMKRWWTTQSQKLFTEKVDCMIKEYSSINMFGVQVNGKFTVDENIADNGGLVLAYDAYKLWVDKYGREQRLPALDRTSDQLFYIGFAQSWCEDMDKDFGAILVETSQHPVHRLRVNGALRNTPHFSQSFGCRRKTAMNPQNRCEVW
ncbi:endothelin-converting enzyme 1-like isoform X2 [Tubulanus polymorphus]